MNLDTRLKEILADFPDNLEYLNTDEAVAQIKAAVLESLPSIEYLEAVSGLAWKLEGADPDNFVWGAKTCLQAVKAELEPKEGEQ